MSEIRTRLHLPAFRLEFEGSLGFYERVVSPLLGGLAPQRPIAAPVEGAAPKAGSESAPGPRGAVEAPPEPAPAPPRDVGGTGRSSAGYRPPPGEFGPFVQKLGPEAAEPDRQVIAFAFFLWNYAKKDVIHEDELAGCFRAIGLAPPADLRALAMGLAQRLRFLAPGPGEDTWTLTTKGANYVKTRLLGGL